jgi:threonine aldolase
VDSNILIFEVAPALGTAGQFAATLKAHGVWMLAVGHSLVRAVTHLDVSREQALAAAEVIPHVATGLLRGEITPGPDEPAY